MFDYDAFRLALRALVATLYGTVTSGDWITYDPAEQEKLNTAMKAVDKVFNKKLRPTYDQTLFDGQDNGKVRSGLEPVRARRKSDESDKPKTPTADEFLDSILEDDTPEQITLDLV